MPYKDKQKNKECKARWQKEHASQHRAASADWQKRNPEKSRAKNAKWVKANPEKALLNFARQSAKRRGLEFSIDVSDVIIPEVCPIFLIPIRKEGGKRTNDSPSLDRIDSRKGYVKGNVWVISWRANSLKSNATLEELETLVSALRKLQNET